MDHWADAIVVRQARPADGLCQRCKGRARGPADWRCVCCFKRRDMCISCLRRDHVDIPFHRVYWWTGRCYRRTWLREAGVAIYLCPRARHGTSCPRNRAHYVEEPVERVPSGLVDRRRDKGKGPARAGPAGAGSGAPGAPAAPDREAVERPAPPGQMPGGGASLVADPEMVSVPRAPPLVDAMDVDAYERQRDYSDDDEEGPPPEVPPEDNDFDSELQMLYAAFDSQLRPNGWEVEEEPGGTDDAAHAPVEPLSGSGADAAGSFDSSGAPGAPDPPGQGPGDAGTSPLPKARGPEAIPDYDLHGFPVLVLIHENGVHGLGVNFCRCDDHLSEYEQLLACGLFPASTHSPATAYDMESLEKALVETVECRTTTEGYWRKLCRYTVPEDPNATVVSHFVPLQCDRKAYLRYQDRYAITIRVHREYRACREYVGFGFAHQDPENRRSPQEGEMTHRCLACPHESNLPENFHQLPQGVKDLFFHAWTIDGNMKAEHNLSRKPGNNVQILPGTGYFPDPDDFAEKTKKPWTDKSLPPETVRRAFSVLNLKVTGPPGRPGARTFAINIPRPVLYRRRLTLLRIFAAFCPSPVHDTAQCFQELRWT